MRVVIRFQDNEVLEAESDSVDETAATFAVRPLIGNSEVVWISLAAVKYITVPEVRVSEPRRDRRWQKVVLHFKDGEIARAYKDDTFGQEGHCFNVRIPDGSGEIVRAIVSVHALKAVFFVKEWDSRRSWERGYDPTRAPTDGYESSQELWRSRLGAHVERAATAEDE